MTRFQALLMTIPKCVVLYLRVLLRRSLRERIHLAMDKKLRNSLDLD